MAEPVGITGTAVGIVSLCLDLYGGLKSYLDDYKGRDEYIGGALRRVDRLRDLIQLIESAIPALKNDYRTPVQTVISHLKACEKKINSLDAQLKEFGVPIATNAKGKLKETKRRFQFPFTRPNLDKLSSSLDRINNDLALSIQGLELHVRSANRDKLVSIYDTARATVDDIATIHANVSEIQSRGITLELSVGNTHAAIEDTSRGIHDHLSLLANDFRSSASQISEIHANTSSSIRLLRKISATQQLNATRQEESINELANAINAAGCNSPGEMVFRRLMAKPDNLRCFREGFASLSDSTQESSIEKYEHGLICRCRRRRRITRQSSRWRAFTRFDESIVEIHHEPGCYMYRSNGSKHERTLGVVFTGLHRLLNIAVGASLTRRTGAGGASISPTVMYYAMVHSGQSPAFRITYAMAAGITNILQTSTNNAQESDRACQQIIERGISKLLAIFASRSSSPTDINEKGWTMIESCFDYYSRFDLESTGNDAQRVIKAILLGLLRLGIPRTSGNSSQNKLSPFVDFMTFWPRDEMPAAAEDMKNIALLLFQKIPESQTAIVDWHLLMCPTARVCLTEIDTIQEVFGVDLPIFIALLRRDEHMLKDALLNAPASPDSLLSNGISAVHIAVFWPKGLELLLRHYHDADINMKCNAYTPIDMAMVRSGQVCDGTQKCYGSKSVKILLKHGCRLSPESVSSRSRGTGRACRHAIFALLSHIKLWRMQLLQIARRELCEAEVEELGLHSQFILDHAAPKVIQKLEARGILPFQKLQLDLGDYRLSPPSHRSDSSSLYHNLDCLASLQIAYSLGFRDTDTFYQEETPVMRCELDIEYYEWFVNHNASIFNEVPFYGTSPELPLWTVAHHVLSEAGEEWNLTSKSTSRLLHQLGSLDIGDRCDCGCSGPDGCNPLKVFLCHAYPYELLARWESTSISRIQSLFMEAISTLPTITSTIANMIIRLCTFEALEMRHTCCRARSLYDWPDDYGEDFSNIRDEDEELLLELERLVAKFENQFHSLQQPLSAFMEGYWREHMERVREKKEARHLSQEERDAAASLNILLIEDSLEEKKPQRDTVWDLVERCIRELNDIK